MSGLEGLVALGLACSIFQTVSFGRETLDLVKEVYRNGTIDPSLVDKSTAIQEVASDIIAVGIPRSLSKHEQKLFDVAKKCTGFARDLNEEIAFLVGHNAKSSLRATVKTAVKVNWRKRRLERMEKDLADSEQIMQSALLAWIFKSTNAARVEIDSLGEKMRHFVLKYEQGYRQASELVSNEALQVRETIVRESGKTEMAIRNHVTQTSAKIEQRLTDRITQTDRERLQERLLNSLKYPGMNERANQIEDPHTRTFRWLFADQDSMSQSDDEQDVNESQDIDEEDLSIDPSSYSTSTNASDDRMPEVVWSSFTDWLQSDLNMYWIMGKTASGKSTLAKFIVSEPRTNILLGKWRRDVIIASHYFWRPGTLMQRNIKGMLCSIAHQLVCAIPDALRYASLNIRSLDQKDVDTDWAIPDLQRLCLGLIRQSDKPLCLLIDGLDECGPEDDHQELLDILDSFRLQNVKMIVSSRNEPVFERHFRHEPQIRIQDLTDVDLRAYAKDKLHNELLKDPSFASDLVREADGVFLWLVLVVQSLNRGFGNGDSVTDLRKRMRTLPTRLSDLYKDMWKRLNDDADVYRRDAALYFRLVIAAHDGELSCMTTGFSTMELMLASSEAKHEAFAETSMVSASHLLDQCERFRRNVEARCAGLLVAPRGWTRLAQEPLEGLGDTEIAFLNYAQKISGFQFIHRSACDFLLDTIEGQNILLYEGMSSEDLYLCIFSASLRATELLHSMLRTTRGRIVLTELQLERDLNEYLKDLYRLARARDSAVEALFSRCFEVYSSSSLARLITHREMRPARIAAFFGNAAFYPNLHRHSINMIEKRLVGLDMRSAILLAIVGIGLSRSFSINARESSHLAVTRWLLRLDELDVNLKSPLMAVSSYMRRPDKPSYIADRMGPLDHIKVSPFTWLLASGFANLNWKPIRLIQNQPRMVQFLQLVCDFISRGGDLRSTVFLACPNRWSDWKNVRTGEMLVPRLSEMHTYTHFLEPWYDVEDGGRLLCVLALEAVTIIQRMLASLLETKRHSGEENEHNSRTDAIEDSDLEAAVSFLAQKCQEYGHIPNDRVVGLLEPNENFDDMPYRQVSHQDSVDLIKHIWAYMDVSEPGMCWDNLAAQLREVAARSPFSCIGFRDYLRDQGCFDESAAHTLLMEYKEDYRDYHRY